MSKHRFAFLMLVSLAVILTGVLWYGYRLAQRYGDRIADEYNRLTRQVSSYIDDIHGQNRA